ncbi:hypothetical protein HPP92_012122 [Vanilla planifolia]|uniref:non-specific serine/threonine protein kinase n=1 Tax=Vanilla planifolia TaxID=51239 RepID=A0A835RCQ5_VANPL|nr:hypothetical protein HPP92_012122 [Vanilla planifolia]
MKLLRTVSERPTNVEYAEERQSFERATKGAFYRAQTTDPLEVTALRAIQNKLVDTMNRLKTWNVGDPCTSNWTGVLCFNYTLADGYLHVKELQLFKMNLSGTLAPEIGQLSYLKILDFMWNRINGSIPKEIGNISSLELLLLNGNKLSGTLPDELGYLPNLNRIQIDQNQISGAIPNSFASLNKTQHLLLDNNNLTGYLPAEFSMMPNLQILQLDNNNFSGTSIPDSYGNMLQLLKLSLRNCSLQGAVPDLSGLSQLHYLDLSQNQLTGTIPVNKSSSNITTVDLSNNLFGGAIPNFSGLPYLQKLSLENNRLNGSVPTNIWKNMVFTGNKSLVLNFQNNNLLNISGSLNPPSNVSLLLYGNPVCSIPNQQNIEQYCHSISVRELPGRLGSSKISCSPCPSDMDYEYNPFSPTPCFCAIPLEVGYRLKSPGFSNFPPYVNEFRDYLSSGLGLATYQLVIDSYIWEEGPRLRMNLKLFPNNTSLFSDNEVLRIRGIFTGWLIPDSDIFGPSELLNFTLGFYSKVLLSGSRSGLSSGAVVGIVLASVAIGVTISAMVTVLIMRNHSKYQVMAKWRHGLGNWRYPASPLC